MASVTTHDFVSLRVSDGDTPANYIEVTQYGFFTVAGSRTIPATEPIAGGGKVAPGNIATIIRDQLPLIAPIEWQLTLNIENDKLWQLDAFGNARRKAAWQIGTGPTTWTPVTTLGTVQNIFGQAVDLPLPIHSLHANFLFNFEAFVDVPASAPTGVPYIHRMLGNACNGYDLNVQQGELQFVLNLVCFGQVDGNATTSITSTGVETT